MDCSMANITKREIETLILPLIPENKRGFKAKVDLAIIFLCIVHKLKTGCQWRNLFIEIEGIKYPFSWQLAYYYFRKWSKMGVFEDIYKIYLTLLKDKLDTETIYLDGTHTLVKKEAESAAYQSRKKAKTSNVLIMTDGRGIPISIGGIISGNHNDMYELSPQFRQMAKELKQCGICTTNSMLIADKGFDLKQLRKDCHNRGIIVNIDENPRNRKGNKKGRKRFFDPDAYQQRYVNERCFAWIDSFRTLLIRFDKTDQSWLNWHFLAFLLILIKV